ncbi:MAG: phosphoribosylformylglycinamidine synthase subunit PurS [Candidatus Omnitrophica bacterium]|nr:phosphoribosylformylglycinamidine synthase subunit PurS [Candidatus Omnitrophota bacterium]
MLWRVEIREKDGFYDAVGESVKKDISDLGFKNRIKEVKFVYVYLIEAPVEESDIRRICEELLIDPVTQDYSYRGSVSDEEEYKVVEIAYNPGVMDPVEESGKKAIRDLGIEGVTQVKTAKKYLIKGNFSRKEILSISEKILFNKVIQHV